MTTQQYATEGSGTIVAPWRLNSRVTNFTGIQAPTTPGWSSLSEPWGQYITSAVRMVPTEDMQIIELGFTVQWAADHDDPVDVGILDVYGDVLAHTGLTSGKTNAAGDQFISLSYHMYGGIAYYLALSYGTVGGVPAIFKTANYANNPQGSGHLTGFGLSTYGYQDTIIWSSAANASPGVLTGPTNTAFDYGQGVVMVAREY